MTGSPALTEAEISNIWRRRFGSDHVWPCRRPGVTTCALWECQKADECQHPPESVP